MSEQRSQPAQFDLPHAGGASSRVPRRVMLMMVGCGLAGFIGAAAAVKWWLDERETEPVDPELVWARHVISTGTLDAVQREIPRLLTDLCRFPRDVVLRENIARLIDAILATPASTQRKQLLAVMNDILRRPDMNWIPPQPIASRHGPVPISASDVTLEWLLSLAGANADINELLRSGTFFAYFVPHRYPDQTRLWEAMARMADELQRRHATGALRVEHQHLAEDLAKAFAVHASAAGHADLERWVPVLRRICSGK